MFIIQNMQRGLKNGVKKVVREVLQQGWEAQFTLELSVG